MTYIISTLLLFLQVTGPQHAEPGTGSPSLIYTAGESVVRFFSDAPLEDIEATSLKLRGATNMETGQLLFVIPVNSFKFEKSLMQKHFNEQYLETDKYPEARFEGNFKEFPLEITGSRIIPFEGHMTLHGVTRKLTGEAKLTREGNKIHGESKINIKLEDYDIKIPRIVIRNIAETVEVTIKSELQPDVNP